MRPLTNGELRKLEKRIKEIDRLTDLCCSDRDSDVLENLEIELEQIIKKIETAMRFCPDYKGPRLVVA